MEFEQMNLGVSNAINPGNWGRSLRESDSQALWVEMESLGNFNINYFTVLLCMILVLNLN